MHRFVTALRSLIDGTQCLTVKRRTEFGFQRIPFSVSLVACRVGLCRTARIAALGIIHVAHVQVAEVEVG